MKYFLVFLLVINPLSDLDKIARINKAKKEAEKAYLAENYALAKATYLYLKDSLGVEDESLLLNLANTQFLLNDTTNARSTYSALKESPNKVIRSIAQQQLGALEFQNKKYKEALNNYKSALKADPSNSDARYNYELLKKLIKEQEEQQEQQKQQNKDQQNKDQQNKDQQNKQNQEQEKKDQEKQDKQQEEQEKKDQEQEDQDEKDKDKQEQEEQKPEDQEQQEEEQESKPNPIDEDKLKEMKITEEKARLILEAMKNNEVQYIQQNKRKAKKKKDPNKPDW